MSKLPDEVISFRRYLKRRNYAPNTLRSYLNDLEQFLRSVNKPLLEVSAKEVERFIEQQQAQGLSAVTINRRLSTVAELFRYLHQREQPELAIPVSNKLHRLKQPNPLPHCLKNEEVERFFDAITDSRDRAIFTLMLRCGLRVEEVVELEITDLDLGRQQLMIRNPKNRCDRLVYLAPDALLVLRRYLAVRISANSRKIFLVPGGRGKGQGISVRGIQKRIEKYAAQAGVTLTCHSLRHTFASQLLENGADIVTIQALLGHSRVTTTQRYARVSDPKVREDYFRGMDILLNKEGFFS